MITLYKINESGGIQEWTIDRFNYDEIRFTWGVKGGLKQSKTEKIELNQSGRSMDEQAQLRIESRVSRQMDRGYKLTIEEAKTYKGRNATNMFRPMLAQTYDRQIHTSVQGKFMQYKYNGHRCLITNQNGEYFAYSRNGKPITTISHILDDLELPIGATIDGELYIHGKPLQTIASIVKREQADNSKLRYVVYDHISNKPFAARYDELDHFVCGSNVIIAPTETLLTKYIDKAMVEDEAIKLGYEGFMLRDSKQGYEPGKRSSQLLKVKRRLDDEFKVVDITASKDGWGILHCKKGDVEFKVAAPGTMANKMAIFVDRQLFIGKYIQVEFAEYTKDGTPFHPVAICWRDKNEE